MEDNKPQQNFSYAEQVSIPEISDGLYRKHDAFCTVVRRILTKASDEERESLLNKALSDYNADLSSFVKKASMKEMGLPEDEMELAGEDEDLD